jgi:hypothetical protein
MKAGLFVWSEPSDKYLASVRKMSFAEWQPQGLGPLGSARFLFQSGFPDRVAPRFGQSRCRASVARGKVFLFHEVAVAVLNSHQDPGQLPPKS